MTFHDFMHQKFPKLSLRSPLFYNWHVSIRFELGVGDEKSSYLQAAYHRAIALFQAIHAPDDEVLVVLHVHDFGEGIDGQQYANLFQQYLHTQTILHSLHHEIIPYLFPENDEEGKYKTHRFILKCRTAEIKHTKLLQAICNREMGIKPAIYDDLFLIHLHRETIFYIYDDRGCDLLATSPDRIEKIYHKYNDWILDYDRDRIEQIFSGHG